jgi:hypothetical protein
MISYPIKEDAYWVHILQDYTKIYANLNDPDFKGLDWTIKTIIR